MNVLVNHINLNVVVMGSGKPLFLIHGNEENLHIFDELALCLANFYEVHLLDLRNHGQSSKTDDYNYVTAANDVMCYMESTNLRDVYVYGFSDGGIIGLILASSRPNYIQKLCVSGVNINPSGIKKKSMDKIIRQYHKTKSPYLKMMIEQPNILEKDLHLIEIPVLLTVGEYDVIKKSHTRFILNHLKNAQLKIFQHEDHGSYIIHSTKLFDTLTEFFN